MNERDTRLYHAAMDTDAAWMHAVREVYGKEACNARYDARGMSTHRLQALHDNARLHGEAWRKRSCELVGIAYLS